MFTHVAARTVRWSPTGPFLEVLQTIRRLLIRPECFRLEREFAGLGFTRENGAPCQGTHNNTVERCIRPIPLGRKNALFAGSCSGGERWAEAAKVSLDLSNGKLPEGILASVINTAKLHEIDPETYLADALDRIVSGRTKVNALSELLPWNWKAAREAPVAAAA